MITLQIFMNDEINNSMKCYRLQLNYNFANCMRARSVMVGVILIMLVVSCRCGSFSSFSQAVHLQGTWSESEVLQPLGPCNQCTYSLDFDRNRLYFRIFNNQKQNSDLSFELLKVSQLKDFQSQQQQQQRHSQSFVLIKKVMHYRLDAQSSQLFVKISANPCIGTIYSYKIYMNQIGLYIDDTLTLNEYFAVIQLVLYVAILSVLFPIERFSLQRSLKQIHNRVCLLSLYLYSQLSIIMTTVIAITCLQYIYYSSIILYKLLSYMILGPCTLAGLIHNVYCLAAIQKKLNEYLVRNNIYKLCLMSSAMLFGLILFPIILALFEKGIWFAYIYSMGIIVQFAMANVNQKIPYSKFMIMYPITLIFVILQTDKYPILNFHEVSYLSLLVFTIFLAGVLGIGGWGIKRVQNLENIASIFDMNREKKDMEGDQSTNDEKSQTAQNRLKANSSNKNINTNMEQIKSDYSLT